MTKLLQNYPKSSTSSLGNIATSSVGSVPVMYQNANSIYINANGTPLQAVSSVGVSSLSSSSFSQEHELDDLLAEWANMTGFLSALSSIWLPSKQQHQPYHHHHTAKNYYLGVGETSSPNGQGNGSSVGVGGNGSVGNSVGSSVTTSMISIGTVSTTVGTCIRGSSNSR